MFTRRRIKLERSILNQYIHDRFVQRKPIFIAARDVFWLLGTWATPELVEWINAFRPDVLFFQGSGSAFGYRLALWISNKFRIPLVLQLTDDYTASIYRYSLVDKFNKWRYVRLLKLAIRTASQVVAISDEMALEYRRRFGGTYSVLMNSVEEAPLSTRSDRNGKSYRMLYAGNTSIGRWRVLRAIGEALEEVNGRLGIQASLEVFTPIGTSSEAIDAFTATKTIEYRGSLTQEELANEIESCDYLVHVESFDEKMKKITRLSISTKIPEYLSSSRCIYAVGPRDVASMRYLIKHEAAHVTTDPDSKTIVDDLMSLFTDNEAPRDYARKGAALFRSNHMRSKTQDRIRNIIDEARVTADR